MIRVLVAFALMLASASAARADLLDDLTKRGTIRLGVRADAAPFSYHRPDGTPAGLAVALCREVAQLVAEQIARPHLDIEYVTVDARARFKALQDGRTDLHCGPASATLGRRAALDFSILYFVDGAAAAVRVGSYGDIFDIRQARLGVLGGTTTEALVRDLIVRNGMDVEVKTYPTHADGLTALAGNEVAAYFGDQSILTYQLARMDAQVPLEVLPEVFSFEPYALVMPHGEHRMRLAVDRALSTIYDRGQIYQLILSEMGNYQLSPLARAVYQIVGLPE